MQRQNYLTDQLKYHLFYDPESQVYTVLDGASVPNLLEHLATERAEYCCLYSGKLEPDLAETAPYLVKLERHSGFTDWVLEQGWGNHWGIFAQAEADLRQMRRHFRTFLMVYDPDGKPLYFRYYDPRVLRVYLPTCNVQEMTTVFGLISQYLLEGERPESLLCFSQGTTIPLRKEFFLATKEFRNL